MPLRVGKCGQTPFSVHYLSFPTERYRTPFTLQGLQFVEQPGGAGHGDPENWGKEIVDQRIRFLHCSPPLPRN